MKYCLSDTVQMESSERDQRAADWRRARRWLDALPADDRAQLRAYWQRCTLPADPIYLLCLISSHTRQRIDAGMIDLA